MDPWSILAICVGGVVFLLIFYFCIWPYVVASCGWVWDNCIGPVFGFFGSYCCTPVANCCRDVTYTIKENLCGCCDRCQECCSPYQRLSTVER